MLNFIAQNWDSVLVVLIFVGVIIFFAVNGKKQIVYKMLFALVTEAEKLYGSETGSLKFAYVVEKVYSHMPAILKIFVTYDALKDMIERALNEAKIAWGKEAGIKAYLSADLEQTKDADEDQGIKPNENHLK